MKAWKAYFHDSLYKHGRQSFLEPDKLVKMKGSVLTKGP